MTTLTIYTSPNNLNEKFMLLFLIEHKKEDLLLIKNVIEKYSISFEKFSTNSNSIRFNIDYVMFTKLLDLNLLK
jgi:hypothetical protein